MIRPCFKLIGCFLLPSFSWLQTRSLVPLPTLSRSDLSNYRFRLSSAPLLLHHLLRQMKGGMRCGRKRSWMRSEEKGDQTKGEGEAGVAKKRKSTLIKTNESLLLWPGYYVFFKFPSLWIVHKKEVQQTTKVRSQ